MTATHVRNSTGYRGQVLYLAFELGRNTWKLAFTVGLGQSPRIRTIPAGALGLLADEIAAAKNRFSLSNRAQVISCYEAGRDGFWLDRYLDSAGVRNIVVDSASIEVNRRRRRAKSDRLDATKLVLMLVRWNLGEDKIWRTVVVPDIKQEDGRQLHRELIQLKSERTSHTNRIKGLLAGLGLSVIVDQKLHERLESLRDWNDQPVPKALKARILREFERWMLVNRQIQDIDRQRAEELRTGEGADLEKIRDLMKFKGVGINGAWVLVKEHFWRDFRNVRQVGGLSGMTPTPYDSGESRHEQGISKAGNKRVRWVMGELSWCWLRYQPESGLSRWYQRRWGHGNSRMRRIGIVALGRKLLVAFWKYLEKGEVPQGAVMRKTKPKKPRRQDAPIGKEADKPVKKIKLKCGGRRLGRVS
jgi:transposase